MSLHNTKGYLLIWIVILCIFLFLGAVYLMEPTEAEYIRPFFPMLHCIAGRMDNAAEEVKASKTIETAVQTWFSRLDKND